MKLRSRLDLEIYPQVRRSQKVWVVKDPVSLRYFQFRAEEFAVLDWLDGQSSLEEIRQRFDHRFAPRRITPGRLHSFIGNLHRNGLVISDAPGQGEQLLIRHRTQRRSCWLESFSNPLAIRFRGLDPEPFLRRLYPKLSWLFSTNFLIICLTLVIAAVTLVIVQFDSFRSRLPEVNALLSAGNLVWLAVAVAATKLIHELGHALTCKHFGGECHEMGIMLLVFTPCLYCDVTDAWKLSSRSQRLAIGSAGILVEIVLAAICTILWWFSLPGLFNTICMNVMIVCSLGTVLLNGNPLLRYDGYYIVSDLLEMPNLWHDARAQLHRLAARLLAGIDLGKPVSSAGRPGALLLYAVASTLYRTIVLVSIWYFVYRISKPIGLEVIAHVFAGLLLIGACSSPLNAVVRIMKNPLFGRQVKPRRIAFASSVFLLLLAACFLIPLPCRIAAPATLEPRDARRVYVSVPGTLHHSVGPGEEVEKGQPLATLENIDVERELESVRGELLQQQLRIRNLESLRQRDESIATRLPAAREILDDLIHRIDQLEQDQESLTLVSPVDGTVLPPPHLESVESDESQLARWSGTPLDTCNHGAWLERKTLFCLVGPRDQFEAAVFINQSDLQYVRENQEVRLWLEIGQGKVISGTVSEISRVNLQSVPNELGVDQRLSNRLDEAGIRRPQETAYKALVKLEPAEIPMLVGARGRARIRVQSQPLSQRLYRFLSRTFKTVI